MEKPNGIDFQYKVKSALESNGWETRMSPHYTDPFSEKSREIDIIAEKVFLPEQQSIYLSTVIVRLFIECKYITEDTYFWFEKRNLEKVKKIVDATRAFHKVDNNYLVKQGHHFLSDSLIAKNHETAGKGNESDPIFKAINQCLNATIYYRGTRTDLWSKYNHQKSIKELNYSLIVCNSFDKLFGKDTTNNLKTDPIKDSFQLEIDYSYPTKDGSVGEFFYIDVMDVDSLGIFEKNVLSKEIELAKQKMSDDKSEEEFTRMQNRKNNDDDSMFGY